MAEFRHDGKSIDYTPGADVASGAVVVLGDTIAIAKRDLPANELGALHTEGVYSFAKATGGGSAIAAGKKVYWDVAEAVVKEDDEAAANKQVGYTVAATADGDTTVLVKLQPA